MHKLQVYAATLTRLVLLKCNRAHSVLPTMHTSLAVELFLWWLSPLVFCQNAFLTTMRWLESNVMSCPLRNVFEKLMDISSHASIETQRIFCGRPNHSFKPYRLAY